MVNETQESVRDLDYHADFDGNGELKADSNIAAHIAAEREKLLGTPVASTLGGYVEKPAEVEKAAPDEKAVFGDGNSADFLASRYSKKQLLDLAEELGVQVKSKATIADIAIAVQKAGQAKADAAKETSSTVLPAAPEINAAKYQTEETEAEGDAPEA